ncbi:hypothetical protein MKW92_014319 [Papaver armeniacum]|nr:hypothetical protein MKW92_014319 [Papaver armeniacum]
MVTIVLNVSMCCQCNGCVNKVIKSILSFEGITVIGKRFDPVKLREYIALKTKKKKVELISPLPKKPEKETPKEKKVKMVVVVEGTREQREELLKYENPRAGLRQRDGYGYGPRNGYGVDHVRPYEMFRDENPNFCYIL